MSTHRKRASMAVVAALLCGCATVPPQQAEHTDPGATATASPATAAPGYDIHLFRLRPGSAPVWIRNATDRPGYDNQPAFSAASDGFYYSSVRDGGQSDVFYYEIDSDWHRRVTATRQSEFSPTPLPEGGFSTVRVEADNAQHLWRYGPDGKPDRIYVPELDTVGYHLWLEDGRLALFLVDPPDHELVIAKTNGRGQRRAARGIGRGMGRGPGGDFIYVDKSVAGQCQLRRYRPSAGDSSALAPCRDGAEDFVRLADDCLLMAEDRVLYRWCDPATGWTQFADWTTRLAGPVTRLAVSPDGRYLAAVAAEPEGVQP